MNLIIHLLCDGQRVLSGQHYDVWKWLRLIIMWTAFVALSLNLIAKKKCMMWSVCWTNACLRYRFCANQQIFTMPREAEFLPIHLCSVQNLISQTHWLSAGLANWLLNIFVYISIVITLVSCRCSRVGIPWCPQHHHHNDLAPQQPCNSGVFNLIFPRDPLPGKPLNQGLPLC